MHIGAVAEFEARRCAARRAARHRRIERAIEVGLHRVPRYRQRLAWSRCSASGLGRRSQLQPALPRPPHAPAAPGDDRQLKRLAGRDLSQQLDRGKPLWEMWIVEGSRAAGSR
jgi:hypothetical protein